MLAEKNSFDDEYDGGSKVELISSKKRGTNFFFAFHNLFNLFFWFCFQGSSNWTPLMAVNVRNL